MAILIDGKKISSDIRSEIKAETEGLKKIFRSPSLCVILVGNDPASAIYVRNKQKACEEVGFDSRSYILEENTSEDELLSLVDKLNADDSLDGILVQLPLPSHIDSKKIIERIDRSKDVDCFNPYNVGQMFIGEKGFLPCTPAGIMELLKRYCIDPDGKRAVVIGRSNIVGKPMSALLLRSNATVTVCHSHTKDLAEITKSADILVAAVGKSRFVTADMVKDRAVVIDVGMNRDKDGKLSGDVDFENVSEKASYITPVPGGVGPMTIAMLLENTLQAAKNKIN